MELTKVIDGQVQVLQVMLGTPDPVGHQRRSPGLEKRSEGAGQRGR